MYVLKIKRKKKKTEISGKFRISTMPHIRIPTLIWDDIKNTIV